MPSAASGNAVVVICNGSLLCFLLLCEQPTNDKAAAAETATRQTITPRTTSTPTSALLGYYSSEHYFVNS